MIHRPVRWAVALGTAAVLAGGCAFDQPIPTSTNPSQAGPTSSPGAAPGGPPPAALTSLCPAPSPSPSPSPSHRAAPIAKEPSLPPTIADVAGQVEQARGVKFVHPITPEPVTQQRIGQLLTAGTQDEFPADMAARRGRAWGTIGAIPAGTDLNKAVNDFGTSQTIGFYDTQTHRLVFVGTTLPTPLERVTLAHELTHALDDQRFGLSRLNTLGRLCRDDRSDAFLSLAEGDAVETSVQWARKFLTPDELALLQQEANDQPQPPSSVPSFVEQETLFPYPNGQAFVEALLARGGTAAVNAAFRHPPVSTEQILHPEKYPGDLPQDVEVPDLAAKLGKGWSSLDVEDTGEGWLRTLLALRLPQGAAVAGAAGWDGGQYRAWWHGSETAVLLRTVWDSAPEAGEFGSAMNRWLGDQVGSVRQAGASVAVEFGSDAAALAALERVTG